MRPPVSHVVICQSITIGLFSGLISIGLFEDPVIQITGKRLPMNLWSTDPVQWTDFEWDLSGYSEIICLVIAR